MFIDKTRRLKKFQNEAKEQEDGFPSMLLGKLSDSLSGNFIVKRPNSSNILAGGVMRAGEDTIWAGKNF